MTRLEGKNAVITGGTTGIGFATAKRLIDEGAQVLITGQDETRVTTAADELGAAASGIVARAESPDDNARLAEAVAEKFANLDILFANAGVTWPAPLDAIDLQGLQDQFAINFAGPLFTVQKLAPLMKDGSSVILTTSCLDELGMPGMAVYSATKAAVRSLARSLQAELGERGIRINSVAPGPIETPIYGKLGMSEEELGEMAKGILANVPAGRFGQPEEIAGVVAFLASNDSAYMRGAEITADGGWTSL